MELRFAKMHGAGNDFMVARWPEDRGLPGAETVRRWADRRAGVGFDQLLLVRASRHPELAAFYHVFNADGAEVQQCGNGVRCIARFLVPDGADDVLMLGSRAGLVEARLEAGGDVSVNLGEPDFDPGALPFVFSAAARPQSGARPRSGARVPETTRVGQDAGDGQVAGAGQAAGTRQAAGAGQESRYRLELDAGTVEFGAVSVGNPHAVIPVDSLDDAPVGIIGPQLQSHPSFPEGVNVGFVEFRDAASIRLRVYERGAGETAACGTGAAAAAVVGRLWSELGEAVRVEVTGGVLHTAWPGPGHPVWLSGPAVRVFDGRIAI